MIFKKPKRHEKIKLVQQRKRKNVSHSFIFSTYVCDNVCAVNGVYSISKQQTVQGRSHFLQYFPEREKAVMQNQCKVKVERQRSGTGLNTELHHKHQVFPLFIHTDSQCRTSNKSQTPPSVILETLEILRENTTGNFIFNFMQFSSDIWDRQPRANQSHLF